MIESFHFLRPYWLIGILPFVLLAWYWIRATQTSSGWERTVDEALLSVLLDGTHKRSNRWIGLFLSGALAAACVGIAGPTWEKLPQNVEQKNDALIILLDLSLSMLAQDVKPSRVERARQKVADTLRMRTEGQTALIAYAGDAHAVVPLTDDVGTIENLLGSLSPEMMPVYGSNPDHALILAQELFANSGLMQGRILIITDGVDDIVSVTRHRNRAFPISVLGIGTEDGGPIPLDRLRQPGRYYQTQEGNRVIAIIDDTRLAEVAALSYGKYQRAVVGDADIIDVLTTPMPSEDETLDVEREFDTWYDQGHWFALLLIPFCLVAFRRGLILVICLACCIPGPPALAQTSTGESAAYAIADLWTALWQRADQRGVEALRSGAPERATALFEAHPDWRAVAQYRSGDYPGALNGFTQDATVTGRYNQGNSLARLGQYEAAIEQYDQVLAVRPEHEDAQFNKELVERLLQEKQQAEQQQQQEQENQANNERSDSQHDQQESQQDQSEQDQQSDESQEQEQDQNEQQEQQEPQQGDQQEAETKEEETARNERQDALEQWLRRVPDDPGGLLRRKFSHETKQRLRRGEYENRQGEKLW